MRKTACSMALMLFLGWTLGAQEPRDISKEYKETCDRLMCQCGCNEQLSVCAMQNCSSATPMRAEIRERLLKGESADVIVAQLCGALRQAGPVRSDHEGLRHHGMDHAVSDFLLSGSWWWAGLSCAWCAPSRPQSRPPAPVDPRVERELKDFEEES